jgi:hypothetical protein
MGIRILEGKRINEDDRISAVLYSSCTGMVFPILLTDAEEAQSFLDWLSPMAIVGMSGAELSAAVRAFRHARSGPMVGTCQEEINTEYVR